MLLLNFLMFVAFNTFLLLSPFMQQQRFHGLLAKWVCIFPS